MKRVLVTGGAGFIGSNLVAALHMGGYEITVLDNLSKQIHGIDPESSPLFQSVRDKVRFIHGSVCDRKTMESALQAQDVVVHYAAETGTGQSMYQVDHYTRVNIQATAMMLDILGARKNHGIQRLVVASSRSIYGEGRYLDSEGNSTYPAHRREDDMKAGRFGLYNAHTKEPLTLAATDEESLIHPSSVYGITKQVQEQLVMTVCPLLGIEPVALRYQNVYGPGQSLSNPYTGILSIFSNLIMSGKPINVFEDGLESRDFVYIDDVIAATMLAINHPNAGQSVFNVGFGEATDVNTVVQSLLKYFARKVPVAVSGNYRQGDIRHNFADLRRIREQLGFEPQISFENGIAQFVEWARKLGPKESGYQESLSEMKERGLLK